MTRGSLALVSVLLLCAMLAAALAAGVTLPADIRLPTRWGLGGEPDAFADKWTALFLPVLITAGVSLLFYFLPALEPRKQGLERSRGLYLWGWMAVLLMCSVIDLAVLSVALGWGIPANQLVVAGLGIMLVMIGNQLGKSRSMYLIGIRTPWTLASEEVWIRTHRLGGKLMVIGGLVTFAAALLPLPSGLLATVLVAVLGVAAGVPIVYSFLLWRRERGLADQSRG